VIVQLLLKKFLQVKYFFILLFKLNIAGEAAREGRISPGDEIRKIGSTSLNNFTRFEALRLLKGMPSGPIQLEVYKRIC
jgi:C-terminal processing protease CtpA/Prc